MVFHQSLSKGKLELKIAVDATNRQILGMGLHEIGDVDEAGKGTVMLNSLRDFSHLKLD